jgi:RNA polymerase sigma factor (sigma-70 family)
MDSPWPPPVALVEAAGRGSGDAQDRLYRMVQPRLRAFLRYQGFDPVAADELAADTSVVVVDKVASLRNPQAFEAWFWTVARNQIRARIRSRRRDARLVEPIPPAPRPPDETIIEREEHRILRSALAELSASDRELLWLREVENLSYHEIGGRLGAATGAVRVRCHRARRRLEEAYRAVTEPPDRPGGAAGADRSD